MKADYESVRARTFQALDALEVEWIRHSQLLPGAEAILSRLSGEGKVPITLALLTNSGRAATKYALESLGFERYFRGRSRGTTCRSMKPRPEGIAAALKALGLGKSEVLYVGDSPTDIMAVEGRRGSGSPRWRPGGTTSRRCASWVPTTPWVRSRNSRNLLPDLA